MYSPKIREDLIPAIYRIAKRQGVHMTTWVNQVLEEALSGEVIAGETEQEEDTHDAPEGREQQDG